MASRGLSLPHHCREVVVEVTLCLRPPSRRQALSLTEVTATSEALSRGTNVIRLNQVQPNTFLAESEGEDSEE